MEISWLVILGLAIYAFQQDSTITELKRNQSWIRDANLYHDNKTADADRYYENKKKTAEEYYYNQINKANISYETKLKEANHLVEMAQAEKLLIDKKIGDIPVISQMIADLESAKEEKARRYLLDKSNPAPKSAEVVRKVKADLIRLRYEYKNIKYRMAAYEGMFPILKEYDDEPLIPNSEMVIYDDPQKDRICYWLTPNEYEYMSLTERNQLALDRYWNRAKTNKEIGNDYERYVGYLYEQKGWNVQYFGLEEGVNDLGRDLICTDPQKNEFHIVQCKCWSTKKEIHENHINQLFGTTVRFLFETTNGNLETIIQLLSRGIVVPVFFTSTKLSDTAMSFAKSLHISVHQNIPLDKYPMVKCNISRRTGEKIYHLPFDQQYNNIKIDPPKECIVMTVAEAEEKGFRRAYKWKGQNFASNSSQSSISSPAPSNQKIT